MYTGTLTVPKWTRMDRLVPTVPWLWRSDCGEGPRAIWDVVYAQDHDIASCWQIPLYEREGSTYGYLVTHATRGNGNDGGRITLAISMTPRYDLYAQDSFVIAQSNPSRHKYRVDADFWREDGA